MAITEGESETFRLRMPLELRIVMLPRQLTLPPLVVGATVWDAAEHVDPREVQALGLVPLLVTILKERVKASSIVGIWDVCTLTKQRFHPLRLTGAHFPTILTFQCMSLKVKVKENAKDLIRLVPLRPQGGVGETPREDATPLEVVRLLAEQAGGVQ